jgi:hypothetical protein
MLNKNRINPILHKLISIGVILYLGLIAFSALLEWIVYTISLIVGTSIMTANWIGTLLSLVVVVITAYRISDVIWYRANKTIESINKSFKQVIIFSVIAYILNLVLPYFLSGYLFDLMNLENGFLYSVFPSSWDTSKFILDSIETILIALALIVRK